MLISLEFPETAPLHHFNHLYLKQTLVVTLYNLGKLSEREACESLGISRRRFEEMLPEFGFAVLSDQDENVMIELRA